LLTIIYYTVNGRKLSLRGAAFEVKYENNKLKDQPIKVYFSSIWKIKK